MVALVVVASSGHLKKSSNMLAIMRFPQFGKWVRAPCCSHYFAQRRQFPQHSHTVLFFYTGNRMEQHTCRPKLQAEHSVSRCVKVACLVRQLLNLKRHLAHVIGGEEDEAFVRRRGPVPPNHFHKHFGRHELRSPARGGATRSRVAWG